MTATSRTGKPIIIADYNPEWPQIFAEERAMIYRACGRDAFVRIEHMGSTAVPGLAAKPIVDIMPGVRSLDEFARCIPQLEAIGYEYVPAFEHDTASGPGMPFRRYFRKDVDGVRAFHLHTVEVTSDFWRDHLMFRNYLRVHPAEAKAYADLKRRLANEYNRIMLGTDINIGYTDHKTELIEAIKASARARIARSNPVVLVDYDAAWPAKFDRERGPIARAFGDTAVAIEHVGSTAVPGLAAKPVIDIAVGVRSMDASRIANDRLVALGFIAGVENSPDWRYFDRDAPGDAPSERADADDDAYLRRKLRGDDVHVHVVPFGGRRWNRYLLFRDYLRAHPAAVDEYARTKRDLAAEFGRDRLGYVEGKSDIVEEILHRAQFPPLSS